MAGVGHLAVGMAAARLGRTDTPADKLSFPAVAFWSALSFLPDADVVGFALGVQYADEWGHRGATHSLVFSVAVGAAVGVAALLARRPAIRTGIAASLVLASHALLDTLTDGGLGCALFWPFDLDRYFAPWTPIPVSPIGLGILSPYGLYVAAVEILYFAPLMWFAARPRLSPVIPVVVWLTALWLFLSSDPLRERVVRAALRDDTEFVAGFSDSKLSSIGRGDTLEDVRARLGTPLREFLDYDRLDTCGVVRIGGGIVAYAFPADLCDRRGIRSGAPRAIVETLGDPSQRCWLYSRSPDDGYYRARAVCFEHNRVARIIRRWMRE